MRPVHVVGIGMSPKDLTEAHRRIIEEAEVLAGGSRHLAFFPDHPADRILLEGGLDAAISRIRSCAHEKRVVVLASGDPNLFGIAPRLVREFGQENVVIHPNVTAVQAACARLKQSLSDVRVVSLHGRKDLSALNEALCSKKSVMVYTDPVNGPGAIARYLRELGRTDQICVLEDLGLENERIRWMGLEEAESARFSRLTMVFIKGRPPASPCSLHLGMPDDSYAHERGPVTKAEVRAVILAKLALSPGLTLWDVGAGCASIAIEATLLAPGGRVYAVEKDPARVALIRRNLDNFACTCVIPVAGEAPACLHALPDPDRVFVGGSTDMLEEIIRSSWKRLPPGGRFVASAVLMRTLSTAMDTLKALGCTPDVTLVQVGRGEPLAGDVFVKALNPVWIIAGTKGENP